jgi:hypothetical protein
MTLKILYIPAYFLRERLPYMLPEFDSAVGSGGGGLGGENDWNASSWAGAASAWDSAAGSNGHVGQATSKA